jgi:hypothetical protein
MDNPISKELMLKIAQKAAVKPVFLFCNCKRGRGIATIHSFWSHSRNPAPTKTTKK